jgi:protein EFR3
MVVHGDDRHALQHNWVDEIARSKVRSGVGGCNDVNINTTTIAGITVF